MTPEQQAPKFQRLRIGEGDVEELTEEDLEGLLGSLDQDTEPGDLLEMLFFLRGDVPDGEEGRFREAVWLLEEELRSDGVPSWPGQTRRVWLDWPARTVYIRTVRTNPGFLRLLGSFVEIVRSLVQRFSGTWWETPIAVLLTAVGGPLLLALLMPGALGKAWEAAKWVLEQAKELIDPLVNLPLALAGGAVILASQLLEARITRAAGTVAGGGMVVLSFFAKDRDGEEPEPPEPPVDEPFLVSSGDYDMLVGG